MLLPTTIPTVGLSFGGPHNTKVWLMKLVAVY